MRPRLVPVALALLFSSACPGSLENPERFLVGQDAGPSCDVENDIFKQVCATSGCHDAATKTQGLDLETAGIKQRIKTSTATCASVVGQPMGTFLLSKVKGTQTCGAAMPTGYPMLDSAELKCVEDYINDGGLP